MNAKQLKNSILQWAIQSKLVPQDPSDEPASVLLEKIRAEKERLVKEGKLKKKDLEVKPIADDEIPFEIPENWEWVRLQYLCTRFSTGPFGTMVHKEDYVDLEGHPLVNPTNIKNGKIVVEGIKKVSNTKYKELDSYALQINDLVLARRGDLSKIAIVTEKEKGWLAGTGAFFMHFLDGLFLPYFILLYSSYYCQSYLLDQSVGGTMNNLNQKLLSDFLIPLPPLAEQHRIVAKIEELMPLVEGYGKAQDTLDEWNKSLPEKLKKSILQEAIQGRLVPQNPSDEPASALLERIRAEKARLVKEGKLKKKDLEVKPIEEDEIPFEIPKGWEWFRLSDLANMYTGNSISETEKKIKYTGVKGIEYIGTKDVSFEHVIDYANGIAIPEEYVSNFRLAHSKSILLCIEGGSAGRKIGILNRNVCFGNKLCCFETYVEINKYLYYYMQSPMFRDVFKSNINGIIGGVSINTLKGLLVPLPPLSEQKRIVAKVEELFEII